MVNYKNIGLILIALLAWAGSYAQVNETIDGMKQGHWIVTGDMKPEKEYPPEGKIEEGDYKDDRKTGEWIKYHKDGITPRLKGTYVNGRPNGPYIKYHDNGQESEIGTYSNRKMSGEYKTYTPEGVLTQEKTFSANGKENGVVNIYFPDGTLQMTMTKKDGQVQGAATTYWPNGDVKKVVSYGTDGEVASNVQSERVNPPKGEKVETGGGGPRGDDGIIKDGKKYERDGYNKLYNKADEIWMDGEFKSGKLWDGKLYKYDSDGILLKIEIWKDGKYHSDGHLG